MCGICVLAGPGHSDEEMASMLELIRHRGPDSGGQWRHDDVSLGMRRLSIIDVAGGDQPMFSPDRQVSVVFNGEIYNYVELREALVKRGCRFHTSSDTEVLLQSYLEYGADCVAGLRGMFAFAIWDSRSETLFMARDRVGKKPLYHGFRGSDFVACSELKSLKSLRGLKLEIDPIALAQYFQFRFVPGPRTIFRGFSKLPPGHALTWKNGQTTTWSYWSLPSSDRRSAVMSEDEALDVLETNLKDSLMLRLRSDVPIGLFLSGGLDSSVLAGLLSQLSSKPVKTFSVGFKATGDFDESLHAARVARQLGTDHHELRVETMAADLLPRVAWHMDEPFADAAALPTYQMSAVARQHVKVVLSGEGADELFGGYQHIVNLYRTAGVEQLPMRLRQTAAQAGKMIQRFPPHTLTARVGHVLSTFPLTFPERFVEVSSITRPQTRSTIFGAALCDAVREVEPAELTLRLPPLQPNSDALAWLLRALSAYWLPDDLLMKVDKMTMASGVEARAPFLDHVLIERLADVPSDLKVRGTTGKYLLRKLASKLELDWVARRSKHGFNVPLDSWMRGELRSELQDVVSSASLRESVWLSGSGVQALTTAHLGGRVDAGQTLWAILCFQAWYELFLGSNSASQLRCDFETEATSHPA